MSDENANAMRDALIRVAPEHENLIRARDAVVEKWCAEHDIAKDDLSIAQLMEIRKLPEWQNPL